MLLTLIGKRMGCPTLFGSFVFTWQIVTIKSSSFAATGNWEGACSRPGRVFCMG